MCPFQIVNKASGRLPAPHLDLPFAHDLVHDLIVVLVDLGLVIALLVAQDPQGLGALQLDLELLGGQKRRGSEFPTVAPVIWVGGGLRGQCRHPSEFPHQVAVAIGGQKRAAGLC